VANLPALYSEVLDRNYLKGNELEYLADFPDLMVINDEAHHILMQKLPTFDPMDF